MNYFHLLIILSSIFLSPFVQLSEGQTISRKEKQKFLENVANKILDLGMLDALKLSESNKKRIESNIKGGNALLEGIPLPLEIEKKKLCDENLNEEMGKKLGELEIEKDQNYNALIGEYGIGGGNERVGVEKVCQIIWAMENDEFNVKFGILEASKFFDRIFRFVEAILEKEASDDICALFLYKNESILAIFDGLIGQMGAAKNRLRKAAMGTFGRAEFDEKQRINPQNCPYDLVMMRALGRMSKLMIEIVEKGDMNWVKHNYFEGKKNKFCRIKQNRNTHLHQLLLFSDIIDDWFGKNEGKYSLDENIWDRFKQEWIEGRMDISIEGIPPAKRVKSVVFNLAPQTQPMANIMQELQNIELPGKFDLNMSKMQSAQFFEMMEKLREFLWQVDQLSNSCEEVLYKNEDAFNLYNGLVHFDGELESMVFPKLEEGIKKAMKFGMNLAKRTNKENCLFDFTFIRALIEITRSIIHVVVRSGDEDLKEEILCRVSRKYCAEAQIRYDANGELRPRKSGIDILKENYERLRFGIDDWFANKQVNERDKGLMDIWKQYFEKEWIAAKFFVHIEGVVLPNIGQKQLSVETNEIIKELMKKQKELPSASGAEQIPLTAEKVSVNLNLDEQESIKKKESSLQIIMAENPIKNIFHKEKRKPNKITGMPFVWTEWDQIYGNSLADDQSDASFSGYIPNNFQKDNDPLNKCGFGIGIVVC